MSDQYSSKADRFEVDGANSARAFLRSHNISASGKRWLYLSCRIHESGLTMNGATGMLGP
jgi:hypothetical protein